MNVGGVLGFENYSTRFNLKNVKVFTLMDKTNIQ